MSEINRARDRYGLPLTTRSTTAASHYVAGVDRFLAAEVGAEAALGEALAADEGFALAHAALALMAQTQGLSDTAQRAVDRARRYAAGLTRRERRHVEVIATWIGGDAARARALAVEHLEEFPRDALVLSLAEFLLTRSGRRDRHAAALAHLAHLAPHYGEDWYFLGLHAFVHHELDRFDDARRLAERALAQHPRSGPATHSLAHIFYETAAHADGYAFLAGWMAAYDPSAPMHCHLSWHLALHALALGHYGQVLALYERAMRPGVARSRTSMYDAASLLWRLQLYGAAPGPLPWADVCALAARSVAHPGMAFVDANAALALAAGGDEAALGRLIEGLRRLAAQGHPTAGTVVLPLVQGVAAFARGDYAATIRWVEPIMDQIVRMGGSHAQREVFSDTLLEAYLRAGEYGKAEAMLRQRLQRRPSARDSWWLGRAQWGLGQVEQARGSLETAQRRWAAADPEGAEVLALRAALRRVQAAMPAPPSPPHPSHQGAG
jgi:tetratricopeptide (TPR) repeat protein